MSSYSSERRDFLKVSLLAAGTVACTDSRASAVTYEESDDEIGSDRVSSSHPRGALTPLPALATGANVALIAPAGALAGPADLRRAEQNVRALGWKPVPGRHALSRDGYFAGTDAERLADVNWAFQDDDIDAVWCLRGGYGITRILGRMDFTALAERPRAVIGYSDVTALHTAITRRCSLMSLHGPVAREVLSADVQQSLQTMSSGHYARATIQLHSRTIASGTAHGRLAGGNLTLLAALMGTPFAPDFNGALVVLEDINTPVYAVDRMLQQLWMGGAFRGAAGIVFGILANGNRQAPPPGSVTERGLDLALRRIARLVDVPCVAGAPIGHVAYQQTLPLGAMAAFDAEAGRLTFS